MSFAFLVLLAKSKPVIDLERLFASASLFVKIRQENDPHKNKAIFSVSTMSSIQICKAYAEKIYP
jgi:hypothetical protein